MRVYIKLTVFFEEPFWVGVFEKTIESQYQVYKHVFGAEPKDYEVYNFILTKYNCVKYSTPLETDTPSEKYINPKKLQKKISRELEKSDIGTKAQNAIRLQYEENKVERKKLSKLQKELIEKQKFELRQRKKKEKHKGH